MSTSFAGVITEKQHPNLGRIPDTLRKVNSVFRGELIGAGFKTYSVPKPDDPADAIYREEQFIELFYRKGDQVNLGAGLEKFLDDFDSKRTSEIALLQPYLLIATGIDGSTWLISVRRQDSHTSIVPLRTLGDQSPFDQVFWPYLESGYYQSDAPKLQQILRSSDPIWKNDAERGSQNRLSK